MKIGFKKSLFGFNPQEVMSYIKKESEKSALVEKRLKAEIDELNKKADLQNEQIQILTAQLEQYVQKEAEINALADSIANLYVVADITAEQTIKNAELSEKATLTQVEQNIKAVDQTNSHLTDIENSLSDTVSDFNNKVNELKQNLESTKQTLKQNQAKTDEFKEMYESIKN